MVRFYRNAKAAAAFRRLIALEATHPDAGLDTYLRAVEIVGMDEA
jgi:hypothetical protein